MNLGIKRTWTGNIITKLDIKMLRDAMRDVTSIASLPISSEIHFKAFMNTRHVDLWNVIHDMHNDTFYRLYCIFQYVYCGTFYICDRTSHGRKRRNCY